jgi:hypothetical protein
MKKILFSLLILASIGGSAQTDSSAMIAGAITLRTNDFELVVRRTAFNASTEVMYDSIKIRMQAFGSNYPSGTTTWTVGGMRNGELVSLSQLLKARYTKANSTEIDRIHTAIRAINSTYVNSRLDGIDAAEQSEITLEKQLGKKWGRKE